LSVTVENLMDNLNAEESEREFLELVILPQAKAFVETFINQEGVTLSENEEVIKDRCILSVATSYYLDRDTTEASDSRSYAGLKVLIGSIRKPSLG